MKSVHNFYTLIFFACIFLASVASADVYINVLAVNGAPERKETPVRYDLPGDIGANDVLDANGLQVEYDAADANYALIGKVILDSKESKAFRIRIRDIWKLTPDEISKIKDLINKGYEEIGKQYDAKNAEQLKELLDKRIDLVAEQQNIKADTIEKRIDAARSYRKELQRVQDLALAADYWRSEAKEIPGQKVLHLKFEVENPATNPNSKIKEKIYLPAEVKPQHVVDAAGLEVRYDVQKQQPFLFKEEEVPPGEKRYYVVGILDVWNIETNTIEDLRKRASYTFDFLKNSKFLDAAKTLFDGANGYLDDIIKSQAVNRDIKEHISAYRNNKETLNQALVNIENLEKLLNIYREDLEKSKVKNVLQNISTLKGIAEVSKQVFVKKPTPSNTWNFIGYVLAFLGVLAVAYFIFLIIKGSMKANSARQNKEEKTDAA